MKALHVNKSTKNNRTFINERRTACKNYVVSNGKGRENPFSPALRLPTTLWRHKKGVRTTIGSKVWFLWEQKRKIIPNISTERKFPHFRGKLHKTGPPRHKASAIQLPSEKSRPTYSFFVDGGCVKR